MYASFNMHADGLSPYSISSFHHATFDCDPADLFPFHRSNRHFPISFPWMTRRTEKLLLMTNLKFYFKK